MPRGTGHGQVKGLSSTFLKTGKGNRFRYENFSQRVAKAKFEARVAPRQIDVYAEQKDDESLCYFKEELAAWSERNLTVDFKAVARKLYPIVQSLPQVIHHIHDVVKHLTEGIRSVSSISLEPLFGLVCVLARDLRVEIMPHFETIFLAIISTMDTADPELLGSIFKTLSIVFKYLSKELLADMKRVKILYFGLLTNKKEHVQSFAAESWAFLLRKLKGKALRTQCRNILSSVRPVAANTPTLAGVGLVFFELVKSVQYQLHSNTADVMKAVVSSIRPSSESSSSSSTLLPRGEEVVAVRFEIVQAALTKICEHTKREHFGVIWDVLLAEVTKAKSAWKKKPDVKENIVYLSNTIALLTLCTRHRNGNRLDATTATPTQLLKICEEILVEKSKDSFSKPALFSTALDLALGLSVWPLMVRHGEISKRLPKVLLHINGNDRELDAIDGFYESAISLLGRRPKLFNRIVAPALKFYDCKLVAHSAPIALQRVHRMGMHVLEMPSSERVGIPITAITESGKLRINLADARGSFKGSGKKKKARVSGDGFCTILSAIAFALPSDDTDHKHLKWGVLQCLPYLELGEFTGKILSMLNVRLDQGGSSRQGPGDHILDCASVAAAIGIDGAKVVKSPNMFGGVNGIIKWVTTGTNARSSMALESAASYLLQHRQCHGKDDLHRLDVVAFLPILQPNLLSPKHTARVATLEILNVFKELDYKQHKADKTDEDAKNNTGLVGPCKAIEMLLAIEKSPLSVERERERTMHMERLASIVRSGKVPSPYVHLLMHAVLGYMHVKYSRVWPVAMEMLVPLAEQDWQKLWRLLYKQMLVCRNSMAIPVDEEGEADKFGFIGACNNVLADWSVKTMNYLENKVDDTLENIIYMSTSPQKYEGLLLEGMEKISKYAERKSQYLYILFIEFLQDQYYVQQRDVEEINSVDAAGILGSIKSEAKASARDYEICQEFPSPKIVSGGKKQNGEKLKLYLKLFASFNKPEKYCNAAKDMLHFYYIFLYKTDSAAALWALRSIFSFKDECIVTYRDNLERLVDDKKYREEMATFSLATSNIIIKEKHRPKLIDIVTRVSYGKLITRKGRSAKDTIAARRATVLGFLSGLEESELAPLFALFLLPFDNSVQVQDVNATKQMGFVKMLEAVIDQLGSKALPYLSKLMTVLTEILKGALDPDCSKSDSIDVNDSNAELEVRAKSIKLVRSQCLRRFGAIFEKFPDISFFEQSMLKELRRLLVIHVPGLPKSVVGQSSTSSMLELIAAFTASASLSSEMLSGGEGGEFILKNAMLCLSKCPEGAASASLSTLLSAIENLLSQCDENTSFESNPLSPLIPTLLEEFFQRLNKYDDLRKSKRELQILAKISSFMTPKPGEKVEESKVQICNNLVGLLVPFLKPQQRLKNDLKVEIIHVVQALATVVQDLSNYVAVLSRLFMPGNGSLVGPSRAALVHLFVVLSKLPATAWLQETAEYLSDLNAWDDSMIETYDFDRRLGALGKLSRSGMESLPMKPPAIQSIIHQVVSFMYDADYSMRQGAINAVKNFVASTAKSKGDKIFVLESLLMPLIKGGLKSQGGVARKGFLTLLRKIAEGFMDCKVETYPLLHLDLRYLFNTDADQDIFVNMMHVQVHRRARALQKFRSKLDVLKTNTVTNIFLPLVIHDLYEANKASENVLIEESILTIQTIAGRLPWSRYSNVLRMLLTQLTNNSEREKLLIKTIGAIVDAFHFDMSDMIIKTLVGHFLPSLNSFLVEKSSDTYSPQQAVRVPVALAIVKILKRLPGEIMMQQLLKLLAQVCSLLKSKEQRTRNTTKLTLCKMVEELGTDYVLIVITELRRCLREGFMLHVLGNVIHAILNSLPSGVSLNMCLDDVVEVMTEDVFGDVAKQRKRDSGYVPSKDIQEAQSCKSYSTYEIMASRVTFDDENVAKLTKPLLRMGARDRPGKECQAVMKHITIGFSQNPTLTAKSIVRYSLGLIETHISGKEGYEDLWLGYAVDLLNMSLKRRILTSKTKEDRALLDKCVRQLVQCAILCKSDYVLTGSLKMISSMITWDLPAIEASVQPILDLVFKLMRLSSSGSGGTDVRQSCFRTIALLLRKKKANISNSRMRIIISMAEADLDQMFSQNATFSLIKAIIKRQVVLPEAYDLVTRISKLLITSLKPAVQNLCAQVLSDFLKIYPMGNKRRQEHMNAVLKNLAYPYETGRLSALKMMERLVNELSTESLNLQAKSFYVQMVLRLVNEDSKECLEKVSSCLVSMLEKIGSGVFDDMIKMAVQWVNVDGEDTQQRQMRIAGLKCIASGFEARPKRTSKHFKVISRLLKAQEERADESDWETIYHALVAVEKAKIYVDVATLMRHDHPWVRAVACRVLKSGLESKGNIFTTDESIFQAIKSTCHQLKADLNADAAGVVGDILTLLSEVMSDGSFSWLFTRTSYLLRQSKSANCQETILNFYKVMAERKTAFVGKSLNPLLEAVYRIQSSRDIKSVPKESRLLAEEVMDVFESNVGGERYMTVLERVRGVVFKARTSRKRERQIERVTDPASAARKKLRKNKKKTSSRKRRLNEIKMLLGR